MVSDAVILTVLEAVGMHICVCEVDVRKGGVPV